VVDPAVSAGQFFDARLPGLLARTTEANGALRVASRVWMRADTVDAVPRAYTDRLRQRLGADAGLMPSAGPEQARQAVNEWVAGRTRGAIAALLPPGSVTPTTKLVLTNAVHFKSPWERPFDVRATAPRPFATPAGPREVPTMVAELPVRRGTVERFEVLELPFAGRTHTLLLAMPPRGEALPTALARVSGLDLAAWPQRLQESVCQLQLPRFKVGARVTALKPALESLGVRQAFTDRADLSPMLGRASAGAHVEEVFHTATIDIDERGGEASAATAATVQAKSFVMPAPACAVDRPFLFAVVHRATGAPLFMGWVSDPAAGARPGP
jgi:serpin B